MVGQDHEYSHSKIRNRTMILKILLLLATTYRQMYQIKESVY